MDKQLCKASNYPYLPYSQVVITDNHKICLHTSIPGVDIVCKGVAKWEKPMDNKDTKTMKSWRQSIWCLERDFIDSSFSNCCTKCLVSQMGHIDNNFT